MDSMQIPKNTIVKIFTDMKNKLFTSIKRFSITYAVSIVIMLSSLAMVNISNLSNLYIDIENLFGRVDHILVSLIFTAVFIMPITASIEVLLERGRLQKIGKWGYLIPVLFGVFFVWAFEWDFIAGKINEFIFITEKLILILASYIAFVITPYLLKREGLGLYFLNLFSSFAITIIFSIIIFLGVLAIHFSINGLFYNFSLISDRFYASAFFVVGFGFSTLYFLSNIPTSDDKLYKMSSALKILLLYILLPLLSVYTVVLYAYLITQITNFSFPDNMVANLVHWYLIISLVVLYFIFSTNDEELSPMMMASKSFARKYMFMPLLPMLALIISIYIRISSYGFTVPRFYLMLTTGYVAISFVLFILMYKNKKIVYNLIPLLGVILVLITSIGPLSATSISKYSQYNRLYSFVSKAGLLNEEGKLIHKSEPAAMNLDESSSRLIYENASYYERKFELPDFIENYDTIESYWIDTFDYSHRRDTFKISYYKENDYFITRTKKDVFYSDLYSMDYISTEVKLIDDYTFASKDKYAYVIKKGEREVLTISTDDLIHKFITVLEENAVEKQVVYEADGITVTFDLQMMRVYSNEKMSEFSCSIHFAFD